LFAFPYPVPTPLLSVTDSGKWWVKCSLVDLHTTIGPIVGDHNNLYLAAILLAESYSIDVELAPSLAAVFYDKPQVIASYTNVKYAWTSSPGH